jgi:hypothetical protein
MKFFLSSFLAIFLVCCSGAPTDPSILREQLALLDTESTSAPQSSPHDIINLYKILYYRFDRFKPFKFDDASSEESSKFLEILLRYHKIFQSIFTLSPLETLQTVRLYGSLDLASFFSEYITMRADAPNLFDMKFPLQEIKNNGSPENDETILYNYEYIAQNLILTPFAAPSHRKNSIDSNIQGPYSAAHDWDERKEFLREIIRMFKKVHEKSADQFIIQKAFRRIKKYEFLIKEFQVDEQGPCIDHFTNSFRHLQSLSETSENARRKYFFLIKAYRRHLINYQFTDPSIFPQPMLATVCRKYFDKKESSKLLNYPTRRLLQKANKDLRENRLEKIYKKKKILRPTFKLANYRGLWHNLLNLEDGPVSKEEKHGDVPTPKENNLLEGTGSKEENYVKDVIAKNGNPEFTLTPKEKWFVKVSLSIPYLDLSINSSSLKYELDKFATQLASAKDRLPYFLGLFSSLKYNYSSFQNYLVRNPDGQNSTEISLMHSILLEYYRNCQHFFTNSSKEYLLRIRLEGNFALAYLFLVFALRKTDLSFNNLKRPLDLILGYNDPIKCFMDQPLLISAKYGLLAKEILQRPYKSKDQTQNTNSIDLSTTPENSYSCIVDWKERKEILAEIVNSFKDLSEMTKEIEGKNKFLWGKIEKYEFIIREFQVDNNGPSMDHCVQIFHQLQRQVKQKDFYGDITPITKKLHSLFKVYYQNLYEWQFINPILCPRPMLAIISHQDLNKRKIFKLLKLPIRELVQEAVKSLEEVQIEDIISRIKNLESNFILAKSHDLTFRREVWHNLINREDVLTPFGKWIVKVYLALSR